MRKIFLLNYNDECGSREAVKKAINDCPLIITWRSDLPNSFYLISESDAKSIAKAIRNSIVKGRFIVVDAGNDFYGWNYPETWYLFENKTHKPAS